MVDGMVEVADGMVVIMEVVMAMLDRAEDKASLTVPPTKHCLHSWCAKRYSYEGLVFCTSGHCARNKIFWNSRGGR